MLGRYDLTFPRQIFFALLAVAALSFYPLYRYATREILVGCFVGCGISFFNVLVGYFSIEYAFDKPNPVFLKVILGGMGLRLLLIAAVVIVLIKVFDFHVMSLTAALFFFYFLFMVFEIMSITKKISLKKNLAL